MNAHIDSQRRKAAYNYVKKAIEITIAVVAWTFILTYRAVVFSVQLAAYIFHVLLLLYIPVALFLIAWLSYGLATGAFA